MIVFYNFVALPMHVVLVVSVSLHVCVKAVDHTAHWFCFHKCPY
jgi:hypothetical protein